MIGRIIGVLLLLLIIYAVYWVYTKTWPGQSIKDTLRPFIIFQIERSTSSTFGFRFQKKNWFEVVPPTIQKLQPSN